MRFSVEHWDGAGTAHLVGPTTTMTVTEGGDFNKTVVFRLEESDIGYIEACLTVGVAPVLEPTP